ncbi:MAG: response regulator transcription factor [Sandaracinaceae bacterium]|nr:response regulator transcription factor [Sandaracinaceae bacterium]
MADEPQVLIVEDEAPILDGLRELFENAGFGVAIAAEGASALERITKGGLDMILLDWMIPKVDGLTVLRTMRAKGDDTPVLLLTARGAEDDVVAGLEAGADDYVTKPFGVRELVARAKGLLRRPRSSAGAPRRFAIGTTEIDLDAQTVGPEPVRLTAREATLIAYLVERRHRPVTREELLVDVWGYNDGSIRTRTVDVHVQQLRAKLKAVGGESWIETVRGRGYRFVAELG